MLRSVAEMEGQIVDNRRLRLAGTFFSLPAETADYLIRDLYAYICEQFGDICVLDWKMRDRVVKDIEESLKKRKQKSGAYMMRLEGGIRCERIRNKTSFRRYLFDATYPSTPRTDNLPMLESVDYAPYYDLRVRPYMKDRLALKTSALRLFDLDGRMHLQESGSLDVHAFFHVAPMLGRNDPDKPRLKICFTGSSFWNWQAVRSVMSWICGRRDCATLDGSLRRNIPAPIFGLSSTRMAIRRIRVITDYIPARMI